MKVSCVWKVRSEVTVYFFAGNVQLRFQMGGEQ